MAQKKRVKRRAVISASTLDLFKSEQVAAVDGADAIRIEVPEFPWLGRVNVTLAPDGQSVRVDIYPESDDVLAPSLTFWHDGTFKLTG